MALRCNEVDAVVYNSTVKCSARQFKYKLFLISKVPPQSAVSCILSQSADGIILNGQQGRRPNNNNINILSLVILLQLYM